MSFNIINHAKFTMAELQQVPVNMEIDLLNLLRPKKSLVSASGQTVPHINNSNTEKVMYV